jgi:hypothetical protein
MERATEFPVPLLVLAFASRYQLEHPLTPDSLVFFPGNERHGIWSAKQMMTVIPPTWAPGYPIESAKNPAAQVAPNNKTAETKKVSTPGQRQPGTKVARPGASAIRSGARIVPKGT